MFQPFSRPACTIRENSRFDRASRSSAPSGHLDSSASATPTRWTQPEAAMGFRDLEDSRGQPHRVPPGRSWRLCEAARPVISPSHGRDAGDHHSSTCRRPDGRATVATGGGRPDRRGHGRWGRWKDRQHEGRPRSWLCSPLHRGGWSFAADAIGARKTIVGLANSLAWSNSRW
jgi:hypothetical protein